MKQILKISFLIIIILVYMFSNKEVYSFKDKVLYDANSKPHTETVPEAGDVIEVPTGVDQTDADYAHTKIIASPVKEIWDGSKDENGWCYISIGGVNRYLVALAPLYGVRGDFVDIYITNNGVSTVYPCIIVDVKDVWEAFENEHPYEYEGKKYGHLNNTTGKCKIVECIMDPYDENNPLCKSLSGVTKIVNGGNIQEHPDGPVGLDGNYGSSSSNGNGSVSFSKKLGQLFRRVWIAVVTLFENDSTGNNASTVMITL